MSLERLLNSPDWIRISSDLRAFCRRHFNDDGESVQLNFRHLKPAMMPLSLSVPGQPDPGRASGVPARADPWHTSDYQLVRWRGQEWVFSPKQRGVIRLLWEAWEAGEPEVTERELLTKSGSESVRLHDLFRLSPAWGVLIVRAGKGTLFRLACPTDAERAEAEEAEARVNEVRGEPADE